MKALEEASKFIDLFSKKIDSWYKYDEFMVAFLDAVIKRMDATNTGLVEKIQTALKAKIDVDSLADTITDAVKSTVKENNSETLHKIEDIMRAQGIINKDLKALLGIIHYNILLQKRLLGFREIFNTIKKINLRELNSVEAKKKLLEYGPSLSLAWNFAEAFCRSAYEREIFDRIVTGKSGFDSEKNAA